VGYGTIVNNNCYGDFSVIKLDKALSSLYPNCAWALEGEKYDGLKWFDKDTPKPTKTELDSEVSRLQVEYDRNEYQRLRAAEYPSIQQQLDMQYWDSVNGTTTWQDAINAVKAKYPKP
jgi:hypothetical protein